MTNADDELFASMIAEAIGSPNAREIPPEPSPPNARAVRADYGHVGRCPCGSGHYAYNLYDVSGKLLMYCCHICEKPRRARGETLTKDGSFG